MGDLIQPTLYILKLDQVESFHSLNDIERDLLTQIGQLEPLHHDLILILILCAPATQIIIDSINLLNTVSQ